jgi:hypothetical protein
VTHFKPFSLLLLGCCLLASCSILGLGSSNMAPRSLEIQGEYDLIDAFGVTTACIVRIFWQDDAWRGWVSDSHETPETCPWEGYELPPMRMRGERVRMAIACPRSGCPTDVRRGTVYLLDVVPGVLLAGRAASVRMGARWHNIRLVHRRG